MFRDNERDMGHLFERRECRKIARRQRVFEPFARAAERIIRQHPHDGIDVVAAGAADKNRRNRRQGSSLYSQPPAIYPKDLSGVPTPPPPRALPPSATPPPHAT